MPARIDSAVLATTVLATVPLGGVAPAPSERVDDHPPLRLAIIGLSHAHVEGPLYQARERDEIQIVGVWEPNRALFDRFKGKYELDESLYFEDLGRMLDEVDPDAASVMTSIADHLMAVEACAPRGVHALVEKPLAVSVEHAERIAALSREHGVHVLTNYETSWYASLRETGRRIESGEVGAVRRAVFRHGHPGPVEIGCSAEFLEWLTDPEQNGAGALFDFGCYGAVQMTVFMNGQRPESVSATTRQLKPDVYPDVDDDATIVVAYPGAVGVIQASWAWTHDVKETDVYAERGSMHAGRWGSFAVREPDGPAQTIELEPTPAPMGDEWSYLRALVQGRCAVDPVSSLEHNLIVVEILDAARESARTGRAVQRRP